MIYVEGLFERDLEAAGEDPEVFDAEPILDRRPPGAVAVRIGSNPPPPWQWTGDASMENWWTEIDNDVLRVLAGNGAMAPGELARRLGISEEATASLLSMLVQDGRVRICLVESR